jgi:hypothetical protein
MKREAWKMGEESKEWHDEVKFISENYDFIKDINEDKEYAYQPSILFSGPQKLLSCLQNYSSEETVWKYLFVFIVAVIILTMLAIFYAI